jgi:hypothetical protein
VPVTPESAPGMVKAVLLLRSQSKDGAASNPWLIVALPPRTSLMVGEPGSSSISRAPSRRMMRPRARDGFHSSNGDPFQKGAPTTSKQVGQPPVHRSPARRCQGDDPLRARRPVPLPRDSVRYSIM